MNKLDEILNHKNMLSSDIPKIPLYMDQITNFIDEIYISYKLNDDEKILTKTMINNYVKAKIIDSPTKKKYNKSQIMKLIIIYKFKSIISINEIEKLFSNTDIEIEDMYDLFTDTDEIIKENIKKNIDNKNDDKIKIIFKLLLNASIQKRIAEQMIKTIIE